MINFVPTILIALPIIGATLVSMLVFDLSQVPSSYFHMAGFLFTICVAIFAVDFYLFKKKPAEVLPLRSYQLTPFQRAFTKYFTFLVIVFCFLDMYFHGIVFYNYIPGLYQIFDEKQRRIRHISSLVWTFGTISFFIPQKWIKFVLLVCSVVFPVLFVDRGRLQFALLSVVFIYIFFFRITWKKIALMLSIFLVAGAMFSLLGKDRSGAGDGQLMGAMGEGKNHNPTKCAMPAQLPFSDFFKQSSIRMQWLMVYAGVPLYNLQMQIACDYRNDSIIKAQLIPFWARTHSTNLWALVSVGINVATEYLPFVLVAGYFGIFIAVLVMWSALMWVVSHLKKSYTIFDVIIFSKLSTSLVFSMFSSLFFVWSNLGFIALFILIKWSEKNKLFNSLVCKIDEKLIF